MSHIDKSTSRPLWRTARRLIESLYRNSQHPVSIACVNTFHVGIPIKLDLPFVMTWNKGIPLDASNGRTNDTP